MEGAPSITSSLPDEIEGSCGENLQLQCKADGQPNPEVNDFSNFEWFGIILINFVYNLKRFVNEKV